MRKRILSILLALIMIISVVPMMAFTSSAAAEPVSYCYPVYNKTDGTFYENASSGINKWIESKCTEYTTVSDKTTAWSNGWYVVSSSTEVKITTRVTVSGDVHLILKDGVTLTCSNGIMVSGDGNSLTIYGQTENTGKLTATGSKKNAGIGGYNLSNYGMNITINGGTITANGGDSAAGIGGGYCKGSNIAINGGNVTATGGKSAAGIGGGNNAIGENITINGGTVNAIGGNTSGGAGIGSGGFATVGTGGKNITINGGNVTATGGSKDESGSGSGGAGVGGGNNASGENITIKGGTVTANGGAGQSASGAGIGGGGKGSGINIIIDGGTVTATGGSGTLSGGAGIGSGGGYNGSSDSINIKGGKVIATGGKSKESAAGSGDGIGVGVGYYNSHIARGDAKIYIEACLILKADADTNPPTTEITKNANNEERKSDDDLATLLANKRYAMVEPRPTYSVSCDSSTNGSFSVNKSTATSGEAIIVTPFANSGYVLDKVYYNDGEVHEILPTSGVYSFIMPAKAVTVRVTFIEIPLAIKNATYSANLTLSKNIDVNLKISNIPDAIENILSITVDDNPVSKTFKDGVATCCLKAVEPNKIGNAIHVIVTYDGVIVKDFNYSIKTYCEAVYNHSSYGADSKLGKLCSAILNYAKYAEDYANEQDLANGKIST